MEGTRYHGLDALRDTMMMLGIAIHSAYFYIIDAMFRGQRPDAALIMLTGLVHRFRMPVFFLLAGFFSALLVAKYQIKGAYVNRGKRILLPFLVAVATIAPLTLWLYFSMVLTALNGHMSFILSAQEAATTLETMRKWRVPTFSIMHLWFLHFLLCFYLLIPFAQYLLNLIKGRKWEPVLKGALRSPWTLLVFAGITALALRQHLLAYPAIDDKTILPDPHDATYYGVFFLLGYTMAQYREDVVHAFRKHTVIYGVLAVLSFVCLSIPAATGKMMTPGGRTMTLVGSALCTWTSIYFLCGLFLKRFPRETAPIRHLGQALYWIYLIHVPLVFLFGVLLTPVTLHPILKFMLLTAVTAIASFGSYYLIVRHSWLDTFLSGKWSLPWGDAARARVAAPP